LKKDKTRIKKKLKKKKVKLVCGKNSNGYELMMQRKIIYKFDITFY